jgi:hypothetical protein
MRHLPLTCLACFALLLGACQGPKASLVLRSTAGTAALAPAYTYSVYRPIDRNTADVFVTDLPVERLIDVRDDLAGASGSIVHIHVFLVPTAGRTPIERTACNFTVRQIVIAGESPHRPATEDGAGDKPPPAPARFPAMGLYGGGGFLMPDSDSGYDDFGGTIHDATLRLARATGDFVDRLGVARLTGSFSAPRDDATAAALADRVEQIARSLPEPPEPE